MRIDKYLWTTRYFKTRSQATRACRKGSVKVNGEAAKPSRDVFIGDQIGLRKNQMNLKLEILDVPKSRVGAKLVDLYRKDITPREELEKHDLKKHARDYYRKKGTGRPTKKDRRDLEDFTDPDEQDWG